MHSRKHAKKRTINISKKHIENVVMAVFLLVSMLFTAASISKIPMVDALSTEKKSEETEHVESYAGRQEALENQKLISNAGRSDVQIQEEEATPSPKTFDMEAQKALIEKVRKRKAEYIRAEMLPEDGAITEDTEDSEETEDTNTLDDEEVSEDNSIEESSDAQEEESESYAEEENIDAQNEESTEQNDDSSEGQSEEGWNYDGWSTNDTQGLYFENPYGSYDSPSIYRLPGWTGRCVAYDNGLNDGPSGKETYYIGDIYAVAQKMWNMGYTGEFWRRSDGVYMFGQYVMVAANLSLRPFGTIIKTSVGMGIVCDTGGFAKIDPTKLDIATAWN